MEMGFSSRIWFACQEAFGERVPFEMNYQNPTVSDGEKA